MMESGCQVPAGYTRGTDGSGSNTARLDGFPSFPNRHRQRLQHNHRAIHRHMPGRRPVMAGIG